jgi:hypothetical protein
MATSRPSIPTSIYARVIPVSNRVTENNYTQARWHPLPHVSDEQTIVHLASRIPAGERAFLADTDLGTPSEVIEVAIPGSAEFDLYGQAIFTAIAMVALSRSDISTPNPITTGEVTAPDPAYTPTGLEGIANEIYRGLGIRNPENYFARQGISPQAFIQDFYDKVRALANQMVNDRRTPSDVISSLQDTMTDLISWKWSDSTTRGAQGNRSLQYTIMESMDPNNFQVSPLALNLRCTRDYYNRDTPDSVLVPLQDQWLQGTMGTQKEGALAKDSSPIIGPTSGAQPGYWYARNLIPLDVYEKAAQVLSVTTDTNATPGTPSGTWRSKRLFSPRAPMGTALAVLNKVDAFLGVLLAGAQDVADGILRVIEFLEQRVMEIQEFITRLETYLDIPYELSFPSVKGLVLITNGTSGIVSGLMGSQEKPTEGKDGYAAGLVLVAGSAPSILVELLAAGLAPNPSSGT